MQHRRFISFLFAAFVLLCTLATTAFADDYPRYLPSQFHQFFARYVDTRSVSERMLNTVGLTSNDYGRSFALVAGISKYPHMSGPGADLKPAGEDVRKLVNYLTTYEKFDEIVVLKDADVTEANLSFFLQKYFPRRLQKFPKSRFLFAYSGHGISINGRGYILTSDADNFTDFFNGIPMATLRVMFQQAVDSGHHVLALINACYSGDFIRRSFGEERRFVPRYPGAHAITAGGTKEKTWHDAVVGTGSLFFEKFFAGLDGRIGKDGIVTVDELAAYLRREVQISTDQTQNPLPSDLSQHGSLGGFFFFNRLPLVEAKLLPPWDSLKGIPFGARPEDQGPKTKAPGDIIDDKSARIAAISSEAFARLTNGQYDRAVSGYSEAIRLEPTNAKFFENRGKAYREKGDLDRALADFSEAIRLNAGLASSFLGRAVTYRRMNDYQRAIVDDTIAIQLAPRNPIALVNRGVNYYYLQRYDLAIADYSEAIRLDPKYATAFFNRAIIHRKTSQLDLALQDYTESIRLNPKRFSAFWNRGVIYYDKKEYDLALADYSEAIRIDPKHPRILLSRSNVYRMKKDFDRALADINEAIRLDGKEAVAFAYRGLVYYEKGDYDRAIADYDVAIKFNPKDAPALYNRGLAKTAKGDKFGGNKDIALAKSLDPNIEN